MKLKATTAWPAPRGMLKPGEYAIPGDISRTHAKCCMADGCGEIVREAAESGAELFRKAGAPENKVRGRPRRS
jgi:hypothetical protein